MEEIRVKTWNFGDAYEGAFESYKKCRKSDIW